MNKEQIQQKFNEILNLSGYIFYSDGVCEHQYITKDDLLDLMSTCFNLGLDIAADNAEADYTIIDENEPDDPVLKEQIEVYVLKNSILKLKL